MYTSRCVHQTQFIQSEQLRRARGSLESVFISWATQEIIAIDCHVIVTSGHGGRLGERDDIVTVPRAGAAGSPAGQVEPAMPGGEHPERF